MHANLPRVIFAFPVPVLDPGAFSTFGVQLAQVLRAMEAQAQEVLVPGLVNRRLLPAGYATNGF